jgi:DNA-binding MarR family transcriptional regulator
LTDAAGVNAELGWRERGIALAALGASVLARSAFAASRTGGLGPIEMQALVYLTLATEHELPSQPGEGLGSLSSALACQGEDAAIAVDSLARQGLVAYAEDTDDLRVAVTPEGVAKVDEWLTFVDSLFEGWPPDVSGVDDATG